MQISNQRAISGPAAYSDWRDSSTTWPRATSSPTATSTWQLLAAGEREWRSLAIAFAAYRAMFVVGAYTNHPELNNVGAIFILAALFAAASGRLGVKADAVAIACVAAASASLLAMWLSGQLTHLDAVIKQISLYPVMALSRLLKLPPAYRSRLRGVFAVQILVVLWRPVVVTGAAISGLIVAALAFSGESLLPETRLTKQIGRKKKSLANDYLRVLFERGVAGMVCFLVAWTLLIRSAAPDVRYCGVILAIYSFSENNLDNFPFMSLFVLCLSANAGEADGLAGPERPGYAQVSGGTR
jgi:hypothetical protein